MNIPPHFVQELLARTDVVEVVGRYVQLKKAGANFMGLCPFHGEKSASFSVSPIKQFYHCFGCGASGDAIGFLTHYAGMGFVEAVQELAQRTGLPMPQTDATPAEQARERAQREQRHSLSEVLEQAARAYQKQLKLSTRAVDYLKGRGVSGDIAKTFGLGYAPDQWRPLASLLPDYSDARLVTTGMVIATEAASDPPNELAAEGKDHRLGVREGKRYDRFRDRIMFPIRNVKGETIGFGGRVLDKGEPKYLNSPETPLFSKGRELYGLFEARNAIRHAGYALVTEGYMDVVALAQLGFAHAVATLGTACTSDHIHKLFRFTEAVVFSFDGDAAGRRAAIKALHAAVPLAQDTRSIKFLFLPPEHDPDSYIRTHGSEAFAENVRQAVPLSRFLQDTAQTGCDMDTPEGRARFASQARPLWGALPEGLLKRQLLAELAQTVGLGAHELTDLWQHTGHASPKEGIFPIEKSHSYKNNDSNEINKNKRQMQFSSEENQDHQPWRHVPRQRSGQGHSRRGGAGEAFLPRSLPSTPMAAAPSRGELAARLLLTYPPGWAWLGAEDHRLLAAQPEPLGDLLRWLESQWHEHGHQSLSDLRAAWQGLAFEGLAQRLWTQAQLLAPIGENHTTSSANELRRELSGLMKRMLIDDLKARQTQALHDSTQDPQALDTYKQLGQELQQLRQQIDNSPL